MTRQQATAVFYGLGLVWLALDHWTKWLTYTRLQYGEVVSVIPDWLAITYVQNRGAAWSMFSGNTLALGLISLAVSVGLLVYERRFFPRNWVQTAAYALLWSGAVGNMVDRLWHRYVVDMIYVQWHGQYFFPIFNVADIGLNCGVAVLLLSSLTVDRKPAAASSPPAD